MFMARLASSSFNAEMDRESSEKKAACLLGTLVLQLAVKPGASEGPTLVGAGSREAEHFPGLLHRQAGKKSQLGELGGLCIGSSQCVESVVEEQKVVRIGPRGQVGAV